MATMRTATEWPRQMKEPYSSILVARQVQGMAVRELTVHGWAARVKGSGLRRGIPCRCEVIKMKTRMCDL